jgi:hypothetical protein
LLGLGDSRLATWPDDADGDVLRRLERNGFDFSKPVAIDFNVDFDAWPPPDSALELLKERFGEIDVIEPEDEGSGYVCFQVTSRLSYELVTSVQRSVSLALASNGGQCDSWGVLHG